MSIKAGIIGCGNIAESHLAAYQAGGADIVAVYDVNADAASAMAQKLPKAESYSDLDQLLNAGNLDVISVCSPPVFHEGAVIAALQKGIAVICEKPLAHTLESAQAIQQAAIDSGSHLMTAFRHRYIPAIQKIKSLIEEDRIGTAIWMQNTFCGNVPQMKDRWFSKKEIAGGGTLMDTSIHSVDIFRYIFGEVESSSSFGHTRLEGTDVEDVSVLTLKSKSGVIASLSASWVAGIGQAYIEVMGQKGKIRFDYGKPEEIHVQTLESEETLSIPASGGFNEEVAHMLDVIRGKTTLSCTGADGVEALRIITESYGD